MHTHFSEEIENNEKTAIFVYPKGTMAANLTPKEKRFCDEYLISFNGTQSAIKAGYSKKTAKSKASQLLTKVNLQNYLGAKQQKAYSKLEITRDRVLTEIGRCGFSDTRKLYNENGSLKAITDLDDDTAAALAGVDIEELYDGVGKEREQIGFTKKIKLWDKLRALEILAKHFKIYDEAPQAPVININGLSAGDLKALLEMKRKAKAS